MTGAELMHAFILGVEVECRLGNAVSPWHYARGWHITATCGVFGAAAAVGRRLGLDAERMLWALGNASAQSSGLVETLGTMAKSTGVGHSARGGLLAALLAEQGVEGPDAPIEGPRGFLRVMGHEADPGPVAEGLGTAWEMPKNECKPYPCGVVLNPVIDACLDLRAERPLPAAAIRAITVSGHPLLRQRADRPAVTSGREAQVSAQHAVAVALIDGRAGVAEFTDARVRAADVLDLRARVSVREEAGIPVEAARLEIELVSGETIRRFVPAARGSAARPLSDAELEAKFRTLAAHGCPGFDPSPLIAALWAIETAPDAAAVIRMAAHG
jgi:2-methylcitrate dehydratase PrpD